MDRTERSRLTHYARGPAPLEIRRESAMVDWYGPGYAPAEIAVRRSPARLVGEILDEALREIGLADARVLDQVLALWPSLVGLDVARRAQPTAFRSGVLTVEVASAAWLYVLDREHRERIRERVREATAGAVADVRLVPPGRLTGQRPGSGPAGADGRV